MRYKNLENYEEVVVNSVGRGKRKNTDAEAAINMLLESNEIAIQIDGHGFSTLLGVCATLKTADKLGLTKALIIDGRTFLVKAEKYEFFKQYYGTARNHEREHTTHQFNSVKTAKKAAPEVKSEVQEIIPVTVKKPVRTNAEIYKDIKSLWSTALNYGASIQNFGGMFKPVFEQIIADFTTKTELQNFNDYVELACSDADMNYVITALIRNKLSKF